MNEEIMFLGMDICKEIDILTNQLLCKRECTGMNEGELAAYKMGIKNTLSLLQSTVEVGTSHTVVNITGLDDTEELDLESLVQKLSK